MALLSSTRLSEIAQLAEQLTVNQRVAGSSPALGALHTARPVRAVCPFWGRRSVRVPAPRPSGRRPSECQRPVRVPNDPPVGRCHSDERSGRWSDSLRCGPFGAVAQWLEHGTHNPSVVGSIPTRPTRSSAFRRAQRFGSRLPRLDTRAPVKAASQRVRPRRVCPWVQGARPWGRSRKGRRLSASCASQARPVQTSVEIARAVARLRVCAPGARPSGSAGRIAR